MASLFSMSDVKNRPHRSSFDLQSKRAFTAKAGELLPVWWTMTMPGDTFSLGNTWFTRTQPVQTSAYTRIREYYDYFFIPLRQLWKQGPQAVVQMSENPTAAASSTGAAQVGTMLPNVSLSELFQALTVSSTGTTFAESTNPLGFRRGDLAAKLLRYLGYGNFMTAGYEKNYGTTNTADDYNQAYKDNVYVNILPILAYQKVYNDFYRDTQWENAMPYTYNVDYWQGTGSFGTDLQNQLRNYSTLGRTMLDMGYCNWNKDLFMGVKPNSQFGDVAIVNISGSTCGDMTVNLTGGLQNFTGTLSNLQFGTGNTADATNVASFTSDGMVDVQTIEPDGGPSPNNAMWIVSSGSDPLLTNQKLRVNGTAGFPNAQFTNTSGQTKNWQNATLELAGSSLTNDFSILALRQAEALQKWKEITLSGDQTYRDQVYKHFGVTLPSELSDLVQYIGGSTGNIDISEVVNTMVPSQDYAANIAGKGTGAGRGQSRQFTCKEHGILMCIYHAAPILDYDLSGQDPQLLLTSAEDLPIPEFDNLGLQELPVQTLINTSSMTGTSKYPYIGYSPRYYQFKTAIDRVFGAFSTTLRDWVAPVDDSFVMNLISTDTGSIKPLNFNYFKVNPAILDRIFAMQVQESGGIPQPYKADGTWDTDQFLINCQFDIKVVRNLSVTGLPY